MTHRPNPPARRAALALLTASTIAGGCSSYYHITEPTSGRTYLASGIDDDLREETGVVAFRDAVTGAQVSLTNSELVRIGEHEFRELVRDAQAARAQTTPAEPQDTEE